jgi:hypothetical protein
VKQPKINFYPHKKGKEMPNDEEEDKREKEIDKIETVGREVSESRKRTCIPYNFGICNKCSKFVFIEYEGYGNFKAFCQLDYSKIIPRYVSQRVTNCNHFWDNGYKSVRELAEMAHWLDKKNEIGFERK